MMAPFSTQIAFHEVLARDGAQVLDVGTGLAGKNHFHVRTGGIAPDANDTTAQTPSNGSVFACRSAGTERGVSSPLGDAASLIQADRLSTRVYRCSYCKAKGHNV